MPTPMPPSDSMDSSMPAMPPSPAEGGAPEMPQGDAGGDMIMIPRSSFEDLHEILSGIMQGLDEILKAEAQGGAGAPAAGGGAEMAEEKAEMPAGKPAKGGSSQEDEEFLKSMMAEGNNRSR